MLSMQRQALILDELQRSGQVTVPGLSKLFQVSVDTIRRDLQELADSGQVQRVHGGAVLPSRALGNYEARELLSTSAKVALAREGVKLLRPGSVVGIDGGTTNYQLVRAIPQNLPLTVVTHSPTIAAELRHWPLIEVIVIGGTIFRHSQVAMGPETQEAIGRIRLDYFFLGATGVHIEAGATTGNFDEAATKRAFCRQAAETIILVSPEKWCSISPFQILRTEEISTIIVATEPNNEVLGRFSQLGLQVIVPPS